MTVDTSKKTKNAHAWYVDMLFRDDDDYEYQAIVAIGDMMLSNKQRNLQKTSVKNVNIALSHCLRWFAINDIVAPIQFESIGVQNHFRRQRLLRIMQAFLFLESLQSIKFSSQIASRGFTTTQSPSSSTSLFFLYRWSVLPAQAPLDH